MPIFQRLVRFEDEQGTVHYGELGNNTVDGSSYIGLYVNTFEGTTPWAEDFQATGRSARITKVRNAIWFAGRHLYLTKLQDLVPHSSRSNCYWRRAKL